MALSYFLVIRDHGRRGLEGIALPELTRRNIVDQLRSGEWSDLYEIHHIEMDTLSVEDVTDELLLEAGRSEDFTNQLSPADRLNWLHDRAQAEAINERLVNLEKVQ